MASVASSRSWRAGRPLALLAVLGTFRRGRGDPTFAIAPDGTVTRAVQTPQGPASLEIRCLPGEARVVASAWGPGAPWALERAPDLLGESDDPSGFVAHHRPVAEAARRFPGWRVPRSGLVLDALVPAVFEQKVTGQEAHAGWRRLVHRFGSPAPGPPGQRGLMAPPTAREWALVPSWDFLRAGVDPKRSATVVRAARVAGALERAADLDGPAARARLETVPGIGRWTAAEVAQRALGDCDAVSFGDYHVARDVGWVLTGTPVDDDGLAELLEPYAGHRYRVQRLLELTRGHRPRRGPRRTLPTHVPASW